MNEFEFGWNGPGPLVDELSKPIEQISLMFAGQQRPMSATVWRSNGSGLKIYSEMRDIVERKEVGVLQFARVHTPQPDEIYAQMPATFQAEIVVSKLMIEESGIKAESGVVFATRAGDEVVVLAGARPYSLAIRGVPSLSNSFEPEYSLEHYLQVPIQ